MQGGEPRVDHHLPAPTIPPSLEQFCIVGGEEKTLLTCSQHHLASVYLPVTEVPLPVTGPSHAQSLLPSPAQAIGLRPLAQAMSAQLHWDS